MHDAKPREAGDVRLDRDVAGQVRMDLRLLGRVDAWVNLGGRVVESLIPDFVNHLLIYTINYKMCMYY